MKVIKSICSFLKDAFAWLATGIIMVGFLLWIVAVVALPIIYLFKWIGGVM